MISSIISHKKTNKLYIILSSGVNQEDNQHYFTICRLYELQEPALIKTIIVSDKSLESDYLKYTGDLFLYEGSEKFNIETICLNNKNICIGCSTDDGIYKITYRDIYNDLLNFNIQGDLQ